MSKEQKIKILCVEDEQDIRENIAEILRDEGFEVFEAENGKKGFESFVQNNPDLVISDIMMPELDGYGFLKMVRESQSTRNNNAPFIFLSALGQKDDVIKGANSMANDYLIKPIEFDLMIAKINEKTSNLLKVRESHGQNISNLKDQVSTILPVELFSYLDAITQISAILKEQPYGVLPHRHYLEDFNKIHINAIKLRTAIYNSLDKSVIDSKLNAEEEIFSITSFLSKFIQSLGEKFKNRVNFEVPFEANLLPLVKTDRLFFNEALRKICARMFKADLESKIDIALLTDQFNQLIIIFSFKSALENIDLNSALDVEQINKILAKQNCRFEIAQQKEKTAFIVIPSYRLISQN